MKIRDSVAEELTQWLVARRALSRARQGSQTEPDNPVRKAEVTRAEQEKREAQTVLEAALSARGFTTEGLQEELRSKQG